MEDGRQQLEVRLEELPAQRHLIRRPRLTKLLDEANARIILLVAPAGYGKTTLAREWTSQRGRRALWYRARTGASDVAVVARGLSLALAPLSPGVERSVREMLAALRTPEDEPEAIADVLAEELDGWPRGTWLVIDEYELAPQGAPMKLVERFVQVSGAHVLITSRERPSWVEPRDLLYGDAFELRQAALSMTLDEASRVLESATQVPAGLVALADGWPAVIGLAALLPGEVNPTSDVQSALFDYVAQELFDGLDADVQRHLVLLAVPSTLNYTTVRAIVGEDADRVLRDSVRAGLTTIRDQEIEIQPLCRAFLGGKLSHTDAPDERLGALADHLINADQWDDAFELIHRFELKTHLPLVIRRGLRSALSEGRVATVERWVAAAEAYGLEQPELALARAEIYLRRGDWRLSETLASSCAPALEPHLAAQAYLCAGAAAHFLDAENRSDHHYVNALKHDDAMETRRRALWGRFLAAAHSERREQYVSALTALENLQDSTPEHLLRLHLAKLAVSRREGNVSEASIVALSAEPLLEHVEDPFVRSGFMEALADSLNSSARYDEGGRVAELELAEGKRFRLRFVLPMALANLAAAKVGSGDYTAASVLIERSEREDATRDEFTRLKRRIVLARLWLSRNEPAAAADVLSRGAIEGIRADMMGEALATRALAEACAGDVLGCRKSVEEAASVEGYLAPRVLLAATRAILALQSEEITTALSELARNVTTTGYVDSALCSLRAHPQLLSESARHPEMIDVIRVAASRSGDATLASAIGDASLIAPSSKRPLSSRELEVLQLAAQGFRNDQIGGRLFISPMTVKTHFRNIFEKLEVRSRTEAAIKAKEAGLLG
jgi:LuxR family transcriptional regulator, maltose regulon positive regulatory protein